MAKDQVLKISIFLNIDTVRFACPFVYSHVCFPRPLQWSVFVFISPHNVLVAAAFLPQLGHLRPQRRVLTLQERSSDSDLVLLQPAGVAGTFSRHVVLLPPLPVFLILGEQNRKETACLLCVLYSNQRTSA